ncbi:MAG: type 1 glutamine amidotransferase domain-containing protein [bacterium]
MKIFKFKHFLNENKSTKKALILTGDGFQDQELIQPLDALKANGIPFVTAGIEKGVMALSYNKPIIMYIWKHIRDLHPDDFDILIIPGGKAPNELRKHKSVINFVREFHKTGKPIAAICHGPQILVTANIVKGITMTCYPSMKDELIEAGANYVDESLVIDKNIITSRKPEDLGEFCSAIISSVN